MNEKLLFPGTVGQPGLKQEIWHAYAGGLAAGLTLPHGFLLGPPGTGKTAQFVPAIERITGFTALPPVGMSMNMTLDDVILELEVSAPDPDSGEKFIIILEEIGNIGRPNGLRLLTLLSDGFFTKLDGDTWRPGQPGIDFIVVAVGNDDGHLPSALKQRLEYLRLRPYTVDELAEIGEAYVESNGQGVELSQVDLVEIAEGLRDKAPRVMLSEVRRSLSLAGLELPYDAAAVRASLRVDEDGLHLDLQRVLVALLDLGGQGSYDKVRARLNTRKDTLVGWMGELGSTPYIKTGSGTSATKLTSQGIKKAKKIRARFEAGGIL